MLDVTFYFPLVMMVIFASSSQDGGGNSTILRLGGDRRMRGRDRFQHCSEAKYCNRCEAEPELRHVVEFRSNYIFEDYVESDD